MNRVSNRDASSRNNNNRQRNRGRSNNNNNNNRRGPNPLQRSYESNGPDVKIRGNAMQVAEKYLTLARDAQVAGDRILAENYMQHAEHYSRIIAAAQAASQQTQQAAQQAQENQPQPHAQQPTHTASDVQINGSGPQPGMESSGSVAVEVAPVTPVEDKSEMQPVTVGASSRGGAADIAQADEAMPEKPRRGRRPKAEGAISPSEGSEDVVAAKPTRKPRAPRRPKVAVEVISQPDVVE